MWTTILWGDATIIAWQILTMRLLIFGWSFMLFNIEKNDNNIWTIQCKKIHQKMKKSPDARTYSENTYCIQHMQDEWNFLRRCNLFSPYTMFKMKREKRTKSTWLWTLRCLLFTFLLLFCEYFAWNERNVQSHAYFTNKHHLVARLWLLACIVEKSSFFPQK